MKCLICGNEFISDRSSKLCCSNNCQKIKISLYDANRYSKNHKLEYPESSHRILIRSVQKTYCKNAYTRKPNKVIVNQIGKYCLRNSQKL